MALAAGMAGSFRETDTNWNPRRARWFPRLCEWLFAAVVRFDLDAIASVLFRAIERRVRALQDMFDRRIARRERRHAGADGVRDRFLRHDYRVLHHGLSQSFGREFGGTQVGVLQQRGEFFAAHSREQVALAQYLAADIAEGLQHFVARGMTVAIIDVLEVIEVDRSEE